MEAAPGGKTVRHTVESDGSGQVRQQERWSEKDKMTQ